MPLRRVAQVLIAIWQALRSIKQGIDNMSAKIAALTAAFAVLSGSVSTTLTEISSLQQQHQDDLAKLSTLSAQASTDEDDQAITDLISGMQDRSEKLTSAIATLHQSVTQTTTDTSATLAAEGATGANAAGATGTASATGAAETTGATGATGAASETGTAGATEQPATGTAGA